ncbi:MAG TPA: hypothetical protein VHS58_17470, partial [Acetobacteraceae bacterium]|nr:hypothetical protein [Acetobacteraceae bacterium]
TVLAVRRRDWRALLFLGVLAIVLLQVATLVLRWRAGLLPAPRPRPLPAAPSARRMRSAPSAADTRGQSVRVSAPEAFSQASPDPRRAAAPVVPTRAPLAAVTRLRPHGAAPATARATRLAAAQPPQNFFEAVRRPAFS